MDVEVGKQKDKRKRARESSWESVHRELSKIFEVEEILSSNC